MDDQKASELRAKLRRHNIDSRLYNGYSGRGMNGRETTGVVIDSYDQVVKVCPEVERMHRDQLGKRVILY